MAVTFAAGREPGLVSFVDPFDAAPVEKCAGIEKNNQPDAGDDDRRKIEIIPGLFYRTRFRNATEFCRNVAYAGRDDGAADMNDVRLLGKDHAAQPHPGAPKIIARSEFPEAEQTENE